MPAIDKIGWWGMAVRLPRMLAFTFPGIIQTRSMDEDARARQRGAAYYAGLSDEQLRSQLRCAHDEVVSAWAVAALITLAIVPILGILERLAGRSLDSEFMGGTDKLPSAGLTLATHRIAEQVRGDEAIAATLRDQPSEEALRRLRVGTGRGRGRGTERRRVADGIASVLGRGQGPDPGGDSGVDRRPATRGGLGGRVDRRPGAPGLRSTPGTPPTDANTVDTQHRRIASPKRNSSASDAHTAPRPTSTPHATSSGPDWPFTRKPRERSRRLPAVGEVTPARARSKPRTVAGFASRGGRAECFSCIPASWSWCTNQPQLSSQMPSSISTR